VPVSVSQGQERRVVLLVDDDPVSLEIMRRALRDYEVRTRGDGLEAIATVVRERPSALVLEVALPGLSGFEVCKTLRQGGLDLPVLLVSGRMIRGADRVKGLLLGATDYLTKPFEPARLAQKVRSLLESAAPARVTAAPLDVPALVVQARGPRVTPEAFPHLLTRAHELSRAAGLRLALVGLDGSAAREPSAWQELVAELEAALRAEDLLCRLDERRLAILLIDADAAGAQRALDRVLDGPDPAQKGIEVRVVELAPDQAPADPALLIRRALGEWA
jgi:DNA-binding response OmpR family regulator